MIQNIILISSIIILSVIGINSTIVEIPNGKIQGIFNGNYYSFRGIPYAEPPINENRFESPKPYSKNWTEIRDATKAGETCMRLEAFAAPNEILFLGAEDCLFLNIFTPKINQDNLLPVIFFIHGGAFMFGSGDFHDEKAIMGAGNMILVTFNYRLGPLGFMATGDNEILGNMGLKDQRLALRWVHENIRNFGGDPNQILIAGFSAGAASVEYQLLQPGIEHLITAAYSMSGSVACPWAVLEQSVVVKRLIKVAETLKCPNTKSTAEIKKCLKEAKADDIVNSSREFFVFKCNPIVIWGPTVEPAESKDSMLSEMPIELIKKGKAGKVPYLSAYVENDSALMSSFLVFQNENGMTDLEWFNKHYKQILPIMLFYDQKFNNTLELDKYTEKLYNDVGIIDGIVTEENLDQFSKIATQEMMSKYVEESWKLHKEHSPSKLYNYVYGYPAEFGLANALSNRTDIKFGTVHGDDTFLMFSSPLRDLDKLNNIERKHSEFFLQLLKEFAQNGVPKFGNKVFPANDETSPNVQYLFITENDTVTKIL